MTQLHSISYSDEEWDSGSATTIPRPTDRKLAPVIISAAKNRFPQKSGHWTTVRPGPDVMASSSRQRPGVLFFGDLPTTEQVLCQEGMGSENSAVRMSVLAAFRMITESFITTSLLDGIQPGVQPSNIRLGDDEEACVRIERLMASEPVEDGVVHAAEADLQHTLSLRGSEASGFVAMLMERSPRNRPDLLRLVARLGFPIQTEQRKTLVTDALSSASVDLRDAAIQAIETWNDRGLAHLLEDYEDDVRWLSEYANDVAKELTE